MKTWIGDPAVNSALAHGAGPRGRMNWVNCWALALVACLLMLASPGASASCTPSQYSVSYDDNAGEIRRYSGYTICDTVSEAQAACTAFVKPFVPEGWCQYTYNQEGRKLFYAGSYAVPQSPRGTYFYRFSAYYDTGPMPEVGKGLGPSCCSFGDPVNPGNGNKFETKQEFRASGDFPLELAWTYNSRGSESLVLTAAQSAFGRNRSFKYGQRVMQIALFDDIAYVKRPDGRTHHFARSGVSWVGDAGEGSRLESVESAGVITGWQFTDERGNMEIFNAAGALLGIVAPSGLQHTVAYDAANQIASVTDSFGRQLRFEYTTPGLVSKALLPDGGQIQFFYSPSRDLIRVVYPDASVVSYLYDEAERVTSSTLEGALTGTIDESGVRSSTTQYDARSYALSTTLANGVGGESATYQLAANKTYSAKAIISLMGGAVRTVDFEVVNGKLVPVASTTTCADCKARELKYSYDAGGNLDVLTTNGVKADYDYGPSGLLVQKIEAVDDSQHQRKVQTDWDSLLREPTERRTYGPGETLLRTEQWTYNARGQRLSSTAIDNATGATRSTTFSYCDQLGTDCPLVGLLRTINGARTDISDLTSFSYRLADEASCSGSPSTCPYRKGDLWKVTDALGNVSETLAYDGAGRPLSMKDANGVITDFEYHPRGWLTARKVRGTSALTETDDQVTRIEYYLTGLVKKTTLPDGSSTSYTYDAAQRLTRITDGEGNYLEYTLDNAGNRLKEETRGYNGTLVRQLSRVYNALGELTKQLDAESHATDLVYDANGNTDTVTDALGRVSDNTHDPLDRLTKTIQNVGGLNVTTQFQYDAQDNLTQVTDPKGLDTKYTYNGFGDLVRLESPDTGVTTYTYDSAGNRASQTDARGVTTNYVYDALNRLSQIVYPADSTLTQTFYYDAPITACPLAEQFHKGRLGKVKDTKVNLRFCFDRFGHMTRRIVDTGGRTFVQQYTYTKSGQLSKITYPDGTAADYVRDALGRTTQVGVTRPGGSRQILLTAASYYPFGPAQEWVFGTGTKARLFQRSLNQNYQPGFVEDAAAGGLKFGYEFDAVGNLTMLRNSDQSDPPKRNYYYDALNRLIASYDGPSGALQRTYTYDATGNRLSTADGSVVSTYTYASDSHRLTSVDGAVRSYDAVGNTTSIGSSGAEYFYNAANRMVAVKHDGVVTATYEYNGKGEQVRRAMGINSTFYMYDEAGHLIGEYDDTGAPIQQFVWMDDLPVGLVIGPASANQPLHYMQADALGTPRRIIDSVRNVAVWNWPLVGESFGADAPIEDADGNGVPLVFNLRFPGQRYDAATGLTTTFVTTTFPSDGTSRAIRLGWQVE